GQVAPHFIVLSHLCSRGWGLCLDDSPTKDVIDFPSIPPGVLYDVGHQCRLQYGAYSAFCDDMDNVCHTLWCSVGTTCHSKLDAAVDGTSCGVGVQSAERQCTQPAPKYKGRYCVGERKRFRLCNLQACPASRPSFRQVQCSHFDAMLYKGQLHTWVPVVNDVNPCELHCRPSNEYFAEKLRDAVVDGTPCYQGQASRDLCINGICKNVGCDFEIDSGAIEDRCGAGASGKRGYVDVGLIPAGAREIRIEEVAEAANFLALRSEDPDKYFLNGGWIIQWNGDYQVAGTTFTYARTGNWENLTSPGPTDEPIWIQLLFQESNPGVRYEYIIHREADGHSQIQPPEFSWHYGPWTKCTVTCGTGVGVKAGGQWWAGEWQLCSSSCGPGGLSRRAVLCIHSVGLDEQSALEPPACEHLPRPPAETPCNRNVPCPATWAVGNWSECSVTCGPGTQHRSILCTNDTGVPCDEDQQPASEAACLLPPCPRALDVLGPEGSGSGSSSRELFNEPSGPEDEGALGDWSPAPWPSQAGHSPPPPSEQTPGNSLRTNEVSEDSEEALGRRAPQRPSPTLPALSSISTSHSSPNTQGTDNALEPGTPTLSTPDLALRDLQTLAMPGTFLLKAPTGLGHTPWVTALSLGPLGQPDSAEEEPPVDLLPVRNASWQVGNWSEASGAGVEGLAAAGACQAACPPALQGPALPQLVHLFLEGGAETQQHTALQHAPLYAVGGGALGPGGLGPADGLMAQATPALSGPRCLAWLMGLFWCVTRKLKLSTAHGCMGQGGCERDRLSFGFCETLRLLGRCQLPTVRTQCCRSCPQPGRGAPSRGHQRVARR
ncbi:hypothetical protein E2I00_014015, partial [Balaenoptera physalus]